MISVIIPTLNREKVLCETIGYILKQKGVEFELIVIDQTENHEIETQEYLKSISNKIRYYWIDKKGATFARNYGIKVAKGEIFLFLDDDIVPKANLLKNHLENYDEPDVAAVTGRVVEENKTEKRLDFHSKILKNGNYVHNFMYPKRCLAVAVSGGNFSCRKSWLDKVGVFDENYTGHSLGEDLDLGYRIFKDGGKIIYDPEAEIYHLLAKRGGCRKDDDEPKWQYYYFYCQTYFFAKNLDRKYFIFFLFRKQIIGEWIKCIVKGFTRWGNPKAGFMRPYLGIRDGWVKADEVRRLG